MPYLIKKLSLVCCLSSLLLLGGQAYADEALAKSKNCFACHQVKMKIVGPAFLDIAKKYGANAAEHKPMLKQKVLKGGAGVWGQIPMPPHPQVSSEDLDKIIDWILNLK